MRCPVLTSRGVLYQGNRLAGVGVTDDADPTFNGNVISDGYHPTPYSYYAHVPYKDAGTTRPHSTDGVRCVCTRQSGGIVLHGRCFGVFEKNRIVNNARANVGLKGTANPFFDGNTVSGGSGYGIWIQVRKVAYDPTPCHGPSSTS
eukprot:3603469-Rhodomonas_salina.2